MKRSAAIVALGLLLGAPSVFAGPGEVTGVSVIPGSGRATVVIDIRGTVTVQDFTLENPSRVVIDILGARLRARQNRYDGAVRGAIQNIRYAQRTPESVRVVLELTDLANYSLEYIDEEIRIIFRTDESFTAWSSSGDRETSYATAPRRGGGESVASRIAPPVFDRLAPLRQDDEQPHITVTFDSSSVAEVAATFAAFSGNSIVLGASVGGVIFAEITDQPWDVAFQAILDAHGLALIESLENPGLIRIESRAAIAARDTTAPLEIRLFRINYARANSLRLVVAAVLTDRGVVVADTSSNALIVKDVRSRLDVADSLVAALDQPTLQVSIQARLIFVNRTDVEDLGIKYDLGNPDAFFNKLNPRPDPSTFSGDILPEATDFFDPVTTPFYVNLGGNSLAALGNADQNLPSSALDLIFSTAIGNFDLTVFLSALQEVRLADLQAEPLVTTSDNTTANILVGQLVPFRTVDAGAQGQAVASTQFQETGISLEVTPHVTRGRQILLQIHAENSSLVAAASDLGFVINTQEANSEVLVGDGETAVIAGLTVTEITVSKSGIPYLVDLPLIGRLFGFSTRREERRDLLILVTPHIIDPPSQGFEERQ